MSASRLEYATLLGMIEGIANRKDLSPEEALKAIREVIREFDQGNSFPEEE